MEDILLWLTGGNCAIDALFVGKLVLLMMGLELLTCCCGMLAKMRK